MHIIKLDAIDSTNSFLRQLVGKNTIDDFTVVTAKFQSAGKGQMGAFWESDYEKNLMFSVYTKRCKINVNQSFYISMGVALAIRKALEEHFLPQLKIKWPNDILSQSKKICGILIENVIKNNAVTASIIGVGLNVNQLYFPNLPNASSLKGIMGCDFNLEELLNAVLTHLGWYINRLKTNDFNSIKAEYERHLFRKDKPSTFKDKSGNLFPGYIKSVNASGDLLVMLEDNALKAFSLKEITLMY